MKCMYCQGKMEKATAPLSISRKGYHFHWDAIPAYVCTQCGQPYFDASEVDKIQAALSALEEKSLGLIVVE